MSSRRHHPSEDKHDSHRRSSSRHPAPPRVVPAHHQHSKRPPTQIDHAEGLAFRAALNSACKHFKTLLDRVHKEGIWPDAKTHKSVVEKMKHYSKLLSADNCREERKRENTQKAMLWAKQLFEMEALLWKHWDQRQNLCPRYSDCDHEKQAEGFSGDWADSGWTRLQGEQGETQYLRLVKVETMPEGFIPPGY